MYLEPFDDPCFGWSLGLVLKELTFKGHWGSRYIQTCILRVAPFGCNGGNMKI